MNVHKPKGVPRPVFPTRRIILWLAIGLALPAALFALWCGRFVSQVTTIPHRPVGTVPAQFPFAVEAVRFKAADGVLLSGWWVPCPGATRAAVLLHGNRRNRLAMLPHAQLLRAHGYAVLLYDARNHGESDDAPDRHGWNWVEDLVGATDYLRTRGFRQFGLLGLSQGGITIAAAADRLRDVSWAVIECTPADVRSIIVNDLHNATGLPGTFGASIAVPLLEWKTGLKFKDHVLRDKIAAFHCPLLFIAGGGDQRVYPQEARELFDRANEPKTFWLIPGAPHTNFYLYGTKAEYERRVLAFIASATIPETAGLRSSP